MLKPLMVRGEFEMRKRIPCFPECAASCRRGKETVTIDRCSLAGANEKRLSYQGEIASAMMASSAMPIEARAVAGGILAFSTEVP
jgi:hypothetical protein